MPRRTTRLKALASATLGVVIAAPSAAFATSIAVRSLQTSPHVVLDVTVRPGSVAVSRSDFALSAGGDMFAAKNVKVTPGHSRRFRLTFG